MKTVEECQTYVNRIVRSDWWLRRSRDTHIQVKDGRGRRSACAVVDWSGRVIKLPLWARTPETILHELAHHLAGLQAGHTAGFKAAYYALAKRFHPSLAPQLLEQWKGKPHSRIRGLAPRPLYTPVRQSCAQCGRVRRHLAWRFDGLRFCTKRCATESALSRVRRVA